MKGLSLYAGAGGLDEGLIKAGFEIVFANDFDKNACETYKANHGNHIECGDIDLLKKDLLHFQGKNSIGQMVMDCLLQDELDGLLKINLNEVRYANYS